MSQGYIGYQLQQSLQNEMKKRNIKKDTATIVTQVLVDSNDSAFNNPTKPIGSFYSKEEADQIVKEKGYTFVEDAGRGYRRVVPSPKPIAIIENFFVSPYNGKDYHEMFFAHEVEFNDKSIYDKEEIETIEEDKKDYVKYVWKSIDELSNSDFRPKVLLDIIKKDEFTHYINIDESAKTLKREINQ